MEFGPKEVKVIKRQNMLCLVKTREKDRFDNPTIVFQGPEGENCGSDGGFLQLPGSPGQHTHSTHNNIFSMKAFFLLSLFVVMFLVFKFGVP